MSAGEQETELEGQYTCKDCGQSFMTLPELGTHSRTCEARKKRLEEEKRRAPPEGVYKEEADANRILRGILEAHPDISPKHTNEILSWAELKGELHPFEVAHLLSNMRGISSQTANIVSQKYSVALAKAVSEGKAQIRMPLDFRVTPQVPQFPTMFGVTPPTYQPFQQPMMPTLGAPQFPSYIPTQPEAGYPPTPFLTREEYVKMQREQEERSRLANIEDRMNKLDKDLAGALTSLKEEIFERIEKSVPLGREEQYVEETIPIDKEGRPTHPEKAVSVKRVIRPIVEERRTLVGELKELREAGLIGREAAVEERKSLVEQFKELKEAGLITTPKDMMDMLEKRKPAVESVEEHPTVKSMREKLEEYKGALDEYKKDYEKLKDAMADEDRKRMQDTITRLEGRITDLTTRGTGEWRTDEMRVISGLLTDIKDLLKERKPITEVKDILVPQGVTPARPPSERAGVEERGGVLEELGKKGLAIRVIERLRR